MGRVFAVARPFARVALAFAFAFAFAFACASPNSGAVYVATQPDATAFAPVAQMLVAGCGTLDCHGAVGRNLRIYGNTGLRWASTDRPSALTSTTDDEVTQDEESVVALEPELLSAVVAAGGANPERLTLVRKARGTEHHKGGSVVVSGDDRDTCLTSWLAGHTDGAACARALTLP